MLRRALSKVPWDLSQLESLENFDLIKTLPGILLKVFDHCIRRAVKHHVQCYILRAIEASRHEDLRLHAIIEKYNLPLLDTKSEIASSFYNTLIFNLFSFSDPVNVIGALPVEKEILDNLSDACCKHFLCIQYATEEILRHFIKIVPILRKLDGSCYALQMIINNCRSYLKNRHDMAETIVKLVHDRMIEFGSLTQSSGKNPFALNYDCLKDSSGWNPDPPFVIEPISTQLKTGHPSGLILLMLPSLNTLAETYQNLIASRLLNAKTRTALAKAVEKFKTLRDNFKINFNNSIDVMISDTVDNQERNLRHDCLTASIISHRYWPAKTFKCSRTLINLPEPIRDSLSQVSRLYSAIYPNRRLQRQTLFDSVDVELDFDNGTFPLTVPPEVAVLLSTMEFGEAFDLKLAKLASGLNEELTRAAVEFLLKKRIVKLLLPERMLVFAETFDRLLPDCVDSQLTLLEPEDDFADEDEEIDLATLALQRFWPLIANMFKTFGQLSAERIHSTLSMMNKEYKGPLPVLIKLLQHKVKEGALQVSGSKIVVYSVRTMK